MMEDFELLRYVTIGQYFPTGSPIHRLDPRFKIVGLIALAMTIVAQTSAVGSIVGLIVALAFVALARVDVRFALRGLAPSIPILALLALLQLGFGWGARPSGCTALWSWEIVNITTCSIEAVIVLLARQIGRAHV